MADKSNIAAPSSETSKSKMEQPKTPAPEKPATEKPTKEKPAKEKPATEKPDPKNKPEKKEPKETKPPKESKQPKQPKQPKEPKKPDAPQKPPGKIMSMILLPVPFSRGGCCGDTLPFFMSCIVISILGTISSMANLALILAYVMTYSTKMYDPAVGVCINAWWEKDISLFFNLPPILLILHVILLIAYLVSCLFLLVVTILRKAFLLRINTLIGFILLLPTFFVGVLEVLLMSNNAWIHWNFVILFLFTMIFLYSTMIVNGFDKRLQNPPKDEEEDEDMAIV